MSQITQTRFITGTIANKATTSPGKCHIYANVAGKQLSLVAFNNNADVQEVMTNAPIGAAFTANGKYVKDSRYGLRFIPSCMAIMLNPQESNERENN